MSAESYPGNVIDVIEPFLKDLDGIEGVVTRVLRTTDQNAVASLYAADWHPGETEIGTGGLGEPTFQRYAYSIQYMMKGTPEDYVRGLHSDNSKKIRAMLYRDSDLRVALRSLSETYMGVTERFGKLEIVRQQFRANDIKGIFTCLSSLDFWIETNA